MYSLMIKALRLLQIILFLFVFIFAEGKNKVVLNSNRDIQQQLAAANTTYLVKRTINLHGKTVSIPESSVVEFSRKGKIVNGVIIGNNTLLKGNVQFSTEMVGTFCNDEVPVSWLCVSDRTLLSRQIASIFNLDKPCVVKLDKDIIMDGSRKEVNYVSVSGKKRIENSCRYKVEGNVSLHGVSFTGFESFGELFLDLRAIPQAVTIDISDIHFDGCWNTSRFLYCPYKKIEDLSTINISSSTFTRVKNYVIQFRPLCTGIIHNNRFEEVGTDEFSNVIGLNLGDSSDDEDRLCANGFEISKNVFKDFRVPYNDKDYGREAHAILIYGYRNKIRENQIINFYSTQTANGDPGRDCEGIYLKGGDNVVENNYLGDCVGSTPDGAITAKSNRSNNRIAGNTIRHKFGIGIQCYTPNSVIENNKVISGQNAKAGLEMARNFGSTIRNNEFEAASGKEYHSAVALVSCEGISITGNQFNNTSCILTTYKSMGKITFDNNEVNLSGMIYGTNTYYTSPFELHDDTAEYVMNNNSFTMKGVRTSQLVKAPEGFKGRVLLKANELHLEDSNEVQSSMTYLVRNVKSLTVEQNTDRSKKKRISKVSNMNNY